MGKSAFVPSVCLTFLCALFLFSPKSFPAASLYQKVPSFYDALPETPKGGTLRIMSSQAMTDPKTLNPLLSIDANSSQYNGYLWLSLMQMDSDTLRFLPALATFYQVSKDKKRYVFTLNPNAKWQDGTPVTSIDFLYTYQQIQNPKVAAAVLRSYYHGISLSAPTKHTVVFHVEHPKFDTLFQLCGFLAIQKKQFEHTKDFNQDSGIMNPVGNGPYEFDRLDRGHRLILKRNKKWWGRALPHFRNRYNIDVLEFPIISDVHLRYEKFLQSQIDFMEFSEEQWRTRVQNLDKNKFGSGPAADKKIWGLKVDNKSPKSYSYIGWNEKNPIFADKNTRKALGYLINYKRILNTVYYNLSRQCTSPFGTQTDNSDHSLKKEQLHFNRKKAMQLLKSAGWKNRGDHALSKIIHGKKTFFEFDFSIVSSSKTAAKIAQIVKEGFRKSGIIAHIQSLEWNTFLAQIEKRKFDAVTLGWTATLFPNARQIWHSKSRVRGGSNFIGYSNPKVDSLIAESNREFDIKKRNQIMKKINRIIYEDQPYTFLFEPKYALEGLSTKIKSHRWYSQYDGGADLSLFYLP